MAVKDTVEVTVTTAKPTTRNKTNKVEVRTKETFSVMYGDRWYFFEAGNTVEVPVEVKNFLNNQGALAVL